MAALLAACGGFLLAVLWMDLLFDVQAPRIEPGSDDGALASIAAYYRRVTVDAYPMNRLIGAVMIVTLAGSAWRVLVDRGWRLGALLAFACAAAAVVPALTRIVPDAMRLGARRDPPAEQAALAHAILTGHRRCFVLMAVFTLFQIRRALG